MKRKEKKGKEKKKKEKKKLEVPSFIAAVFAQTECPSHLLNTTGLSGTISSIIDAVTIP